MKKYITLFLLSFSYLAFAQSPSDAFKNFPHPNSFNTSKSKKVATRGNENFLKDSTHYFYHNSSIDDYKKLERTLYEYNENDQIILAHEFVSDFFDTTNTFRERSKTHYSYDSENQLVIEWFEIYDQFNLIWENSWKRIYEYENGLWVKSIYQEWSDDLGDWSDFEAIINTYNNDQLLTESVYQVQDYYGDTLQNYFRNRYIYNDESLIDLEYFDTWNPNSNAWIQHTLSQHEYDNQQRETATIISDWFFNESIWRLTRQMLFSYNTQDSVVELLIQEWLSNSMAWQNQHRISNQYDASNNLIETISESYEEDDDDWENYSKHEYSYDTNNNKIQELKFDWEESTSPPDWNPMERYDHFWSEISTSLSESIPNEIQCQYPNPFLQGYTINCELEHGKDYEFFIFDSFGRQLSRIIFTGNTDLDWNRQLPFGMYFIIIQNENEIVYRDKLIIK